MKIGFGFIGILIVLMVIATAIGIPFFNATRYRDLIQMETGDFSADVAEISMNQIPVVDKDTACLLYTSPLEAARPADKAMEAEPAKTSGGPRKPAEDASGMADGSQEAPSSKVTEDVYKRQAWICSVPNTI